MQDVHLNLGRTGESSALRGGAFTACTLLDVTSVNGKEARGRGIAAKLGCVLLGLVIALGVAPRALHADDALPEPLSPDVVIAYARAHRLEIRAAGAKAEAQAQIPRVVSAPPEPMIMTSVDHLPFSGMGANVSLMIQQEFPMSGILGDKKRAAQAEARASLADARTVSLDVEYQAVAAYLMLAELERMTKIFEEQITVARQIAGATQIQLSVGQATAADAVRAELDIARLDGEREGLEADMISASAMLDTALGRPVSQKRHTCAFVLPNRDPPPLADLVAMARKKRPELGAMHERISKARAEVDVMSSMYRPMAFARLGAAYTMTDKAGLMLGFGVSIPIWRGSLDAGVSEAKSMVSMASSDESAMRNMVDGDVAAARDGVVAARIRLSVAHDKIVPLANDTVALSLDAYGAGQAPLVSVLDALRALRETRMSEVVAEVKVAGAWARLGRSVGVVKVGVP